MKYIIYSSIRINGRKKTKISPQLIKKERVKKNANEKT